MSIFIKAGLWLEKKTGYKGEFNLTKFVENLISQSPTPLIFKGVFNQTGITDPDVEEYFNNTGYVFTNWTRISEGYYRLSVNGNLASYINVGQNYLDPDSKIIASTGFNVKLGVTDYYVYTYSNGVLSDNVPYNMFIEIGLK